MSLGCFDPNTLSQMFLEIAWQNWPFKIGLSLRDFKQLLVDSGSIVHCLLLLGCWQQMATDNTQHRLMMSSLTSNFQRFISPTTNPVPGCWALGLRAQCISEERYAAQFIHYTSLGLLNLFILVNFQCLCLCFWLVIFSDINTNGWVGAGDQVQFQNCAL